VLIVPLANHRLGFCFELTVIMAVVALTLFCVYYYDSWTRRS
jgi:hypothetical protein